MLFKQKEKKEKNYVLDKRAILEEYRNQVSIISEQPIEIGIDGLFSMSEFVVYKGVDLLNFPVLQEDGTLREATDKELIEKGIAELHEFEVLVGDTVKSIYDFPISENLVKPIFNKETLQWVESATPEEIVQHEDNKQIEFYNSELNLATKAFTEYDLGLATEDDIHEVKNYMLSINPYKNGAMLFRIGRIQRPSIFDRYK